MDHGDPDPDRETLSFKRGLGEWGLNVQRRVQRLQETSRWASPVVDYEVYQTSRSGLLAGLPEFDLGLGLGVRPALVGGFENPAPGADTEGVLEPSLEVTQRLGPNLTAALTVNTDFAETEVDTLQTNLTRFGGVGTLPWTSPRPCPRWRTGGCRPCPSSCRPTRWND